MAEFKTPLIVLNLIENHGRFGSDPEFALLYSYKDKYDKQETIHFAAFYTPTHDLDQEWFYDVKLLWSKDSGITMDGHEFIGSDWRVIHVAKNESGSIVTFYGDNKENVIYWGYPPLGKDGKELPQHAWPWAPERVPQWSVGKLSRP